MPSNYYLHAAVTGVCVCVGGGGAGVGGGCGGV